MRAFPDRSNRTRHQPSTPMGLSASDQPACPYPAGHASSLRDSVEFGQQFFYCLVAGPSAYEITGSRVFTGRRGPCEQAPRRSGLRLRQLGEDLVSGVLNRDAASLNELRTPGGLVADGPHDGRLFAPQGTKRLLVQYAGVEASRQPSTFAKNNLKPPTLVPDRVEAAGDDGRSWRRDLVQESLNLRPHLGIEGKPGFRRAVRNQFAANFWMARCLGHFHDGGKYRSIKPFSGRTAGLGFLDRIRNQVESSRVSRKRLSPERRDSKLLRSSLREPRGLEPKYRRAG